jgi:hypothetical protein
MVKNFLDLRERNLVFKGNRKYGFCCMYKYTDKFPVLLQKVFISFGCKTVVSSLCLRAVDGFTLYHCVCVKPLKLQMLFRGT